MKNSQLFLRGALHSLAVSVYVFLLSFFMNNIGKFFPAVDNELLAPLAFIMLFVFSALLTGSLVLAKPIMLYLDGQKKESIKLLLFTGLSLFVYLLIFFLLLLVF